MWQLPVFYDTSRNMAPNSERAVHHKMATFQADKPIGHSVAYWQSLEEFEYGFIQPHYQRIVEKKKKKSRVDGTSNYRLNGTSPAQISIY